MCNVDIADIASVICILRNRKKKNQPKPTKPTAIIGRNNKQTKHTNLLQCTEWSYYFIFLLLFLRKMAFHSSPKITGFQVHTILRAFFLAYSTHQMKATTTTTAKTQKLHRLVSAQFPTES